MRSPPLSDGAAELLPRVVSVFLADRAIRKPSHTGKAYAALPPCMSYILYYNGGMGETITFRPDEDAARALEVLTQDGTTVSTAIRTALIDAARRQATARLRAEAEELAADEQDRAEAAQILRDMETLRAW